MKLTKLRIIQSLLLEKKSNQSAIFCSFECFCSIQRKLFEDTHKQKNRKNDLNELEKAQSHEISSLCLTDINNTSACLDFIRLSQKFDIRPIVGVDFRNGAQQQFVLLARNNQGFQNINTYLSEFLHESNPVIPKKAASISGAFIIYPFSKNVSFILFMSVAKEPLERNLKNT